MTLDDLTSSRSAHGGLAVALAFSAVLSPQNLTAFILALAVACGAWALMKRRDLVFSVPLAPILIALFAAAMFSLMGTLPVTQRSDIQLEFLKYAIYAGAFGVGLVALEGQTKIFVGAVIALVAVFFVATALSSGLRFGINQSWPLYPPDQNNSSSFLAPFAAMVLAFRSRWIRTGLLIVLFAFFTFAESRLGVLMIYAVAIAQIILDWRSGLIVLGVSLAITAALSLSDVGPQTTILRAMHDQGAGNVDEESERISTNRLVEFGTSSDNARIAIYERAIDVSARIFPNLIGVGDAEVIELLNTPPIDNQNVFQHAHNFPLQSYLSYGLLATLSFVIAVAGMFYVAITRRSWYFAATIFLMAGYGMIESLISDVRVLTVAMLYAGSAVATTLRGRRGEQSV